MTRKQHSPGFKFRVALDAIKGDKTISDICQEYEIAQSLVHKWKKALLAHGADVFAKSTQSNQSKADLKDKKIQTLYQKVGQLTVERDFLKKSWDNYPHEND